MKKTSSTFVKAIAVFMLPLMFLLSACENQTYLQIHRNDTYEIRAVFSHPKQYTGNVNCSEQIPELKTYLETPGVEVQDQSTDSIAKCVLLLKNQPISKAKAPFVTIKHYGDYYRVTLAPLKQLSFLGENSTFMFQITFPGAVLKVNSEVQGTVNGNTVTWNSAEVLAKGFQVDGQDHAGWRTWIKALILLVSVLVIGFLGLFLGRKHQKLAPIWRYLVRISRRTRNFLHYHWHNLMIKFDLATPTPSSDTDYSGKRVRQLPWQIWADKLKARAETKTQSENNRTSESLEVSEEENKISPKADEQKKKESETTKADSDPNLDSAAGNPQ